MLIDNDTITSTSNFFNVYYFFEMRKHVITKGWIKKIP
jgi:hypothetical protein